MEIAPANVNSFKSIFNNLDTIIEYLTFECYMDRVEINCLDKSKTICMNCTLFPSYFDEYECSESDRFTIPTHQMKKILKSCKKELKLVFDDFSLNMVSLTKSFELILINDDYVAPKPQIPRLPARASIPIAYLKSMVKDIEMFAYDINLITSETSFLFSSEGIEGKFTDEYPVDDPYPSDLNPKKRSQKVKISSDKFSTCIGADKVSDEVEFDVGTDMPLILGMKNEGIELKFMIAPKVDISE